MPIEVDENGTLDLSMKKSRESMRAPPKVPLGDVLSPPESMLPRGGSLHINPALYQVRLLCSVSGCPLADKTLKSLMAANSQELKYVL